MEVVGQWSLMFSSLPQALDEQHLSVDAQFGGVDQRKIFTFAEKVNTQWIDCQHSDHFMKKVIYQ